MSQDRENPLEHAGLAEARFAEWAARVEADESVHFEELLRAHPELTEELSRLHADWLLFAPLLGKVVPGLIASDACLGIAPPSSRDDQVDDLPLFAAATSAEDRR